MKCWVFEIKKKKKIKIDILLIQPTDKRGDGPGPWASTPQGKTEGAPGSQLWTNSGCCSRLENEPVGEDLCPSLCSCAFQKYLKTCKHRIHKKCKNEMDILGYDCCLYRLFILP